MWRAISLAVIVSQALGGNPCQKVVVQQSFAGKVLVPATISGHTNVLVAVPEAVAFSQLGPVQFGVPVATYAPLAYQPQPVGPGITQPPPAAVQPQAVHQPCQCPKCAADTPPAPEGVEVQSQTLTPEEELQSRVAAIFQQSCVACHSSTEHKGGFRLFDESGNMLALPRQHILARVKSDDSEKRMPKGADPLTPEQVADLEKWAIPPKTVTW